MEKVKRTFAGLLAACFITCFAGFMVLFATSCEGGGIIVRAATLDDIEMDYDIDLLGLGVKCRVTPKYDIEVI